SAIYVGDDANGEQLLRVGGRERVLVRRVVADVDGAVTGKPAARLLQRDALVAAAAWQQADRLRAAERPCVGQVRDHSIDGLNRAPLVARVAVVNRQRIALV